MNQTTFFYFGVEKCPVNYVPLATDNQQILAIVDWSLTGVDRFQNGKNDAILCSTANDIVLPVA